MVAIFLYPYTIQENDVEGNGHLLEGGDYLTLLFIQNISLILIG